MKYQLLYTKKAIKDIEKLDTVVKKRIKIALENLTRDPVTVSKRLVNSKIGNYRFRVGDWRIVFDLEGNNIIVLRVGHRREIYR